MTGALLEAALVVSAHATIWFVAALVAERNDLADVAWGLGFVVLAAYLATTRPVDARDLLVYVPVAIWGFRLAGHLHFRNRGKPEDFRYRKWREEWGRWFVLRTWLQVFLFQGLLLLVIAAPLILSAVSAGPPPGWLAATGLVVWGVGFAFEAIGDWQLERFKRDPDSEGRIMTEGLWRYTRHPNYFGEVTLWWGVFLIALPTEHGAWALISPVTVTVLILFVSGIPMLEEKYEGDPEFEEYRRRTSAFFPMPPGRRS